ncbi:MAG: hypothetical protein AAF810_21265 [Cyanobacteria bacterium P01_D01_bin.36]
MMPATSHSSFPFWQYISQPIGQSGVTLIVNPRKFWRQKKVRHIERCWITSYVPEERTL